MPLFSERLDLEKKEIKDFIQKIRQDGTLHDEDIPMDSSESGNDPNVPSASGNDPHVPNQNPMKEVNPLTLSATASTSTSVPKVSMPKDTRSRIKGIKRKKNSHDEESSPKKRNYEDPTDFWRNVVWKEVMKELIDKFVKENDINDDHLEGINDEEDQMPDDFEDINDHEDQERGHVENSSSNSTAAIEQIPSGSLILQYQVNQEIQKNVAMIQDQSEVVKIVGNETGQAPSGSLTVQYQVNQEIQKNVAMIQDQSEVVRFVVNEPEQTPSDALKLPDQSLQKTQKNAAKIQDHIEVVTNLAKEPHAQTNQRHFSVTTTQSPKAPTAPYIANDSHFVIQNNVTPLKDLNVACESCGKLCVFLSCGTCVTCDTCKRVFSQSQTCQPCLENRRNTPEKRHNEAVKRNVPLGACLSNVVNTTNCSGKLNEFKAADDLLGFYNHEYPGNQELQTSIKTQDFEPLPFFDDQTGDEMFDQVTSNEQFKSEKHGWIIARNMDADKSEKSMQKFIEDQIENIHERTELSFKTQVLRDIYSEYESTDPVDKTPINPGPIHVVLEREKIPDEDEVGGLILDSNKKTKKTLKKPVIVKEPALTEAEAATKIQENYKKYQKEINDSIEDQVNWQKAIKNNEKTLDEIKDKELQHDQELTDFAAEFNLQIQILEKIAQEKSLIFGLKRKKEDINLNIANLKAIHEGEAKSFEKELEEIDNMHETRSSDSKEKLKNDLEADFKKTVRKHKLDVKKLKSEIIVCDVKIEEHKKTKNDLTNQIRSEKAFYGNWELDTPKDVPFLNKFDAFFGTIKNKDVTKLLNHGQDELIGGVNRAQVYYGCSNGKLLGPCFAFHKGNISTELS